MWGLSRKKVKEPIKDEIKSTSREAVMELTMINNRTEKEYIIISENNFGLNWATIGDWLHIKQEMGLDGNWKALAAVKDFSIINCKWVTFDTIKNE